MLTARNFIARSVALGLIAWLYLGLFGVPSVESGTENPARSSQSSQRMDLTSGFDFSAD